MSRNDVLFDENAIKTMTFHCVLCGEAVNIEDACVSCEANLPPCCELHEVEVMQEVDADRDMWPSHWHGKAWRNPDGDWLCDNVLE